ncbi:MAG TPA: divalent metal cation transporter [Nannocystaceae bacterium]|nr:divalent metal cation transporter [Nannocystaceae bacterium]
MTDERKGFLKALGPGLLFAGAAVGVSHLVQSTRAGAVYGLSMASLVVAANLFKYPAFSFAPRYAAATGRSLLEAYRRQGRWALVLYAAVTVGTMFAVQGAVTLVTAGLAQALFGDFMGPLGYSVAITAFAAFVTVYGGFRALDKAMKGIVAVLTVSTLAATAIVLPRIEWGAASLWPPATLSREDVFFVAALVGWMPTALDIGVWHSLWTLARRQETGHAPTLREVKIDFDIGYVGTAVLALCFVALGAGVMHGAGVEIAASPAGFANQVIALYTACLGEWSRPMIATAAFGVMLSTVLTVIDGFPRALAALSQRVRGPEPAGGDPEATRGRAYAVALVIVSAGSLALVGAFAGGLKALVDLATTLSFLTAPLFAVLNHLAMRSPWMPVESRPGAAMMAFSAVGIVFQAAFAAWYVWLRFGG